MGITDLRNACDFLLKDRTPIKAAYSGVVIDIKDGIDKNYDKVDTPPLEILAEDEQDGNFVVIKHKNGEYTFYGHLKKGGVAVKKGQEVKAGEIIGYSGNTGWSVEPHLHFAVLKQEKPNNWYSLKPEWK